MKISGRLLFLAALATISVALIFNAVQQSEPYLTVTQVVEHPDGYQGKEVRVIGTIANGPATDENSALRFRLADAQESINVMYIGPLPQNFRIGAQAVVVGTLSNGNILEASSILLKCPSKYGDESQDRAGLDYTFYATVGLVAIIGTCLLFFALKSSWRQPSRVGLC